MSASVTESDARSWFASCGYIFSQTALASLGMDNFAFFADISRQPWVETRYTSFAQAVQSRGRSVLRYSKGSVGDWLASLPKPCGVFAANDRMAERVASDAFARGIGIPSEIALLGCDDNPHICEHAEVSISSIRQNYSRCAKLAIDALDCAMSGKRYRDETTYGDIGITRRASTRIINGNPAQISSVLEYIRQNALSGISADDVLRRFHCSRRAAEINFRRATGRSILDEIHEVRLAEVKRLLSNPSVKIGSIASRTGYGSENFLARLFKRKCGVTMREFRSKSPSPQNQRIVV